MSKLYLFFIIVLIQFIIGICASAQTGGDAIIYPNTKIGKTIDAFYLDLKGAAGAVSDNSKATDFFITDDMNGVRISIYGDESHPAHPSEGVVVESQYTTLISSINRAKATRGAKGLTIFASKKLDGKNSFPTWTKDANGVIVAKYVTLITDYIQFMKNKGIEIDVLGIDNEEQYNEGNITPAKHKAIVEALRLASVQMSFKMPLIIGYEDYGPSKNNWMKTMSQNGWLSYMDMYGTHYYPDLRPIDKLISDLNYAGTMPFWSTEPHWDNKADQDDWIAAEQAMCALWDQVEVGMTGFIWWAYSRSGSLRGNLMRETSVPIKDAQMIDMDDKDGRNTATLRKLQTRAFIKENRITVYAINNSTSAIVNYGFGLATEVINGSVSYNQWVDGGAITPTPGIAAKEGDTKFRLTLPSRSITSFTFTIAPTVIKKNESQQTAITAFPNPAHDFLTIDNVINSTVDIYNTIGIKMLTSKSSTINISTLKPGLYTLVVQGRKPFNFIKE